MTVLASLALALTLNGATTTADSFNAEAAEWLLAGEGLPVDWRHRLKTMAPADRIQALVFLRRSGLLKGQSWSIEDILAPPLDVKNDEGQF